MKLIDKGLDSPIISEERWEQAKQKTLAAYQSSTCLSYVKDFFSVFESTNRTKYRSDLADFVFESNLEDFCGDGRKSVMVSTIHKAKGREFDSIYLFLDGEQANTDEKIRKLYVAMTRAKQNLYIHCNTKLFEWNAVDSVEYEYDTAMYPEPDEIMNQLTFHDVFLDFFKGKKQLILQLKSGVALCFDNVFFRLSNGKKVAALSKQKRGELRELYDKGYVVKSAKVNYIVAWKNKEDTEETAVILPEIVLKRRSE